MPLVASSTPTTHRQPPPPPPPDRRVCFRVGVRVVVAKVGQRLILARRPATRRRRRECAARAPPKASAQKRARSHHKRRHTTDKRPDNDPTTQNDTQPDRTRTWPIAQRKLSHRVSDASPARRARAVRLFVVVARLVGASLAAGGGGGGGGGDRRARKHAAARRCQRRCERTDAPALERPASELPLRARLGASASARRRSIDVAPKRGLLHFALFSLSVCVSVSISFSSNDCLLSFGRIAFARPATSAAGGATVGWRFLRAPHATCGAAEKERKMFGIFFFALAGLVRVAFVSFLQLAAHEGGRASSGERRWRIVNVVRRRARAGSTKVIAFLVDKCVCDSRSVALALALDGRRRARQRRRRQRAKQTRRRAAAQRCVWRVRARATDPAF